MDVLIRQQSALRRVVRSLSILLLCGALGCSTPPEGPIDPTPRPDPLGPGRASGTVQISAPQMTLFTDAKQAGASHPDLLFWSGPALYFSKELAASDYAMPVRHADESAAAVWASKGTYTWGFNYEQLPLGAYVVKLGSDHKTPEWPDGATFTLTRQAPAASEVNSSFALERGTGKVHGKLLLNGDRTQKWVRLDWGAYTRPNFKIDVEPQAYGRVWYSADDLPLGNYYARLYGSQTYATALWDAGVYSVEMQFTLAAQDDRALDLATEPQRFPGYFLNPPNDDGGLHVNLRRTDGWPDDVVVEARNIKDPGGNDLAWVYVQADGHPLHPPGDEPLGLYHLKVGEYRVRLIGLGATNADPVTVMDETTATIPPPAHGKDQQGNDLSYWIEPTGDVTVGELYPGQPR